MPDTALVRAMSVSITFISFRLNDLDPLMHRIIDRNNENDIFVLNQLITVEKSICLFSASSPANL